LKDMNCLFTVAKNELIFSNVLTAIMFLNEDSGTTTNLSTHPVGLK
jgi:hypothetical protein